MDLIDVETVVRPTVRADLPAWRAGDAMLAGGTWVFSEPQHGVRRLIDLAAFDWPPVEVTPAGLRIAATCTLRALERLDVPGAWQGAALLRHAAGALAGSFKVTAAATVGGNLVLALPAAPIAALAVALDAVCEVWTPDGRERHVSAGAFLLAANRVALYPGEVLRALFLPEAALRRRAAIRRASLVAHGRSAALLVGTLGPDGFSLTIAAAVGAPVRLDFAASPDAAGLASAIDAAIPDGAWWDDVHGAPAWRRHITLGLADEIRAELAGPEAGAR